MSKFTEIEKYVNKKELQSYFKKLFPICRSITGNGFKESLRIIGKIVDLKIFKFKTGAKVLDWTIPKEWNISDAYIITPDGKKIADFKKHNLHVVNYSHPIQKNINLEDLKKKTSYTANYAYCNTLHNLLLQKRLGFLSKPR